MAGAIDDAAKKILVEANYEKVKKNLFKTFFYINVMTTFYLIFTA